VGLFNENYSYSVIAKNYVVIKLGSVNGKVPEVEFGRNFATLKSMVTDKQKATHTYNYLQKQISNRSEPAKLESTLKGKQL